MRWPQYIDATPSAVFDALFTLRSTLQVAASVVVVRGIEVLIVLYPRILPPPAGFPLPRLPPALPSTASSAGQ